MDSSFDRRVVLALLASISLLMLVDIGGDIAEGAELAHVLVEAAVALLAGVGVAVLARAALADRAESQRQLALTHTHLEQARGDADRWREEADRWRAQAAPALRSLGDAIDEQLRAWSLTEAEREVAMLLLKGLSLKEIATVRDTSEPTARQQSQAVYRKSGLAGRAELSAFFLEDLLPGSARG